MTDIWILVEHLEGEIADVTYEMVTAARSIEGARVTAVCLSADGALADTLATGPFDAVLSVTDEALDTFTPEGYAQALAQLVRERGPDALLIGHTTMGYDIGPKIANRLDVGLASEVTRLELRDGDLIVERPVYNRKLVSRERLRTAPWLISIQVGAFPKATGGGGAAVETVPVSIDRAAIRWQPEPIEKAEVGDVDITAADVIVAAGRGLQKPENLGMLEELAQLLGGVVAGSRPVVDEGWLPRDRQVGTSGKTVKPKLYLAVGISGAIQHIVGMKGSETIVAINKDPDAPIFNIAHYGVVGDLFEVVPKLIEKLKAER